MNAEPQASGHELLEAELGQWRGAGQNPRFFLRDDDAISDTPALRRLIELCDSHGVPLLLAAIPRDADHNLSALVRGNPLVTGAVHGYAHIDHTPPGTKVCELGADRPLPTVLGELAKGRNKLLELFDGRLSGLLVPPWNRIHDPVLEAIGTVGFSGVSRHGWPAGPTPGGLAEINTHIDIIHWSGGAAGRSHDWVFAQLAQNLGAARKSGWQAVGVLTHHLDHDAQAWAVLESCLELTASHNAEWIAADSLL